jgi:predicted nucleic acid-binding protein
VTLVLDADVLINWMLEEGKFHSAAQDLVDGEVRGRGGTLGLVPQVLHEFLHVATDPRRFRKPLPMSEAIHRAKYLWESDDVVRVVPGPDVVPRAYDLLEKHGLGRKRILDTVLAATMEAAGIRRLATFNRKDFEVFPFLEIVSPRK